MSALIPKMHMVNFRKCARNLGNLKMTRIVTTLLADFTLPGSAFQREGAVTEEPTYNVCLTVIKSSGSRETFNAVADSGGGPGGPPPLWERKKCKRAY